MLEFHPHCTRSCQDMHKRYLLLIHTCVQVVDVRLLSSYNPQWGNARSLGLERHVKALQLHHIYIASSQLCYTGETRMISWLYAIITAGGILLLFGTGAALFAVRRIAYRMAGYDTL